MTHNEIPPAAVTAAGPVPLRSADNLATMLAYWVAR